MTSRVTLIRLALLAALSLTVLGAIFLPRPAAVHAQSSLLHWAYVVQEDADSLRSLELNGARFQYVSPRAYFAEADGGLKGGVSGAVVASARRVGAKILPMVQNTPRYAEFSPVLQQTESRSRLAQRIVDEVARNGWDGIHVDFEAVEPGDRDALTAFYGDLSGRLHSIGKLSTIAVPVQMSGVESRWAAAYDFRSLGEAGDLVVLMAYSFRTPSSAPGSVSPIGSVERASRNAAAQIPPGKLLIGIGLWGYDWRLGETGGAMSRKHAETSALGTRHSGEYGYDAGYQSAWLRYRDAGGERVIWYEDRRSVAAKVDVASRVGAAGAAYWRLGQEDPSTWTVVGAQPSDLGDSAVEGGRFFRQTGGGGGRGYRVVDSVGSPQSARFYSEFRRLGGVTTLGYPVSRPYVGPGGFTYQAFQRGVLQWRPEIGAARLANTFDQLSEAGLDDALAAVGIPRSAGDDGSGGDWSAARRIRLGWLSNDLIREQYRRNPNPQAIAGWSEAASIEMYGLPTSRPERSGPFVAQRFQRAALQLWVEDVPGMPRRGSVVGILGGDLLKQHGLIPAVAAEPESP